jgi:hypothetical protein
LISGVTVATEARPAFIAITGRIETEALEAALRFADCLREASGEGETDSGVAACAALAAQAFGGDAEAWAPLVAAVRRLLDDPPAGSARALRSRRELRAFVAENADLLDS